ncbi:MAG: nitroreductase family protein [Bacteroidales bacterium]|nr:nitroreductase family protein [Bacteroidales bacterium]
MKTKLIDKLSDISRIHRRAAFTDVLKHTAPKPSAFLNLAAERYSCRGFDARPVPEEMVESILEAARLAPTAVNRQPVHVWVARSAEALEKLGTATPYIYGAGLVFVVGCKPADAWVRKYDGKNGAEVDAAIVGTHIMMEAADLGLGSVWVGSFDPAALASAFPELADWDVVALFPVGWPAAEPSSNHASRKSLEEFASEL